jgi:hypothetical protein
MSSDDKHGLNERLPLFPSASTVNESSKIVSDVPVPVVTSNWSPALTEQGFDQAEPSGFTHSILIVQTFEHPLLLRMLAMTLSKKLEMDLSALLQFVLHCCLQFDEGLQASIATDSTTLNALAILNVLILFIVEYTKCGELCRPYSLPSHADLH